MVCVEPAQSGSGSLAVEECWISACLGVFGGVNLHSRSAHGLMRAAGLRKSWYFEYSNPEPKHQNYGTLLLSEESRWPKVEQALSPPYPRGTFVEAFEELFPKP